MCKAFHYLFKENKHLVPSLPFDVEKLREIFKLSMA